MVYGFNHFRVVAGSTSNIDKLPFLRIFGRTAQNLSGSNDWSFR